MESVISMIPDSQAQPQRHHILRDPQMMGSIKVEQIKRMGCQPVFQSKKLKNLSLQKIMQN